MYDADKKPIPSYPVGHPKHLWFVDFIRTMGDAMRTRQGSIDVARMLETWVRQNPAFEEVEALGVWIPTDPWHPPSETLRHSYHNTHEHAYRLYRLQSRRMPSVLIIWVI